MIVKVVANEDTMLRTQCCRHNVADTNGSPFARAQNLCPRHKKIFLIFVRNILCPQQMFPRLRAMDTKQMFCVPLVCPPKKHHEQQCVGNNVSSFSTTLKIQITETFLRFNKEFVVGNHKEKKIHNVSGTRKHFSPTRIRMIKYSQSV